MGGHVAVADELIEEGAQAPLRYEPRIEIAEGTGGGVPRVCEGRLPSLLALGIRPLECLAR